MKPRVLIADDHRLVAEGLKQLLEPEYDLIGIVENGRELLREAEKSQPDLIIVDVSMPELNGIEAVRALKKRNHGARILFLTMHSDTAYAAEALAAGASGYLLKHSAASELIKALREVSQGRTYVTTLLGGEFSGDFSQRASTRNEALVQLSVRQREILQLVAEGKSAKEIGEALYISSRTVEFHKYKMMKLLGICSSAELVQFAIKHGVISPD